MAQLKDLIVNGATRLIGTVYAPTQPAGTNNDTIATTAFVIAAIAQAIHDISGK